MLRLPIKLSKLMSIFDATIIYLCKKTHSTECVFFVQIISLKALFKSVFNLCDCIIFLF